MDKIRIEAIRKLADNLANYVRENGLSLFNKVNHARYYRELSYELCRAKEIAAKKGQTLFTFDDFIEVFAESEESPRPDWSLARDLVIIRMIDQLSDIFAVNPNELEEVTRDVPALD